jgi:hypothetical protein
MSKTERELSQLCALVGLTLVHEPRQPYSVRFWDGGQVGPFGSAAELRAWLRGFSFGAAYHLPGCQCGRVACEHRNSIPGSNAS